MAAAAAIFQEACKLFFDNDGLATFVVLVILAILVNFAPPLNCSSRNFPRLRVLGEVRRYRHGLQNRDHRRQPSRSEP